MWIWRAVGLNVAASKTDAGVRRVDLAPHLLDELKLWKATTRYSGSDDYVFPTEWARAASGTR
jgi:integrase